MSKSPATRGETILIGHYGARYRAYQNDAILGSDSDLSDLINTYAIPEMTTGGHMVLDLPLGTHEVTSQIDFFDNTHIEGVNWGSPERGTGFILKPDDGYVDPYVFFGDSGLIEGSLHRMSTIRRLGVDMNSDNVAGCNFIRILSPVRCTVEWIHAKYSDTEVIYLGEGGETLGFNNLIRHNTIFNSKQSAIRLSNCDESIIDHNTIGANGDGVRTEPCIYVTAGINTEHHNVCKGSTRGMQLVGGRHKCHDNLFDKCSGRGIHINNADESEIYGNSFHEVNFGGAEDDAAIYAEDVEYCTVWGNKVRSATTQPDFCVETGAGCDFWNIWGNDFREYTTSAYSLTGGNNDTTVLNWT